MDDEPWAQTSLLGRHVTAQQGIAAFLAMTDPEPLRNGLEDTPRRWVNAMLEMTAGYHEDPAEILGRTFDDDRYDELVLVRDVDFTSLCEHHLLPFVGVAHVGYLPQGGRVVGLSKLGRLVDCFARRLQIQERMTTQIADAIQEHLDPFGVGVVVRARHSCMGCRGVRKPNAAMVTSSMLGALRDQPASRSEFLRLCGEDGG